jgi:UDPglucose 6-dehydrogenase
MSLTLTVIGCGYLGATHAAAMAELGHQVIAIDIDQHRIDLLAKGEAPMHEPGLDRLLKAHAAGLPGSTGRLHFTTDYRAARDADVHFLCTGTPQLQDGGCNLAYLNSAALSLAPHLFKPCLVVGKSTVPVGTAQNIAARIQQLAPVGEEAEVAWNPEFLREGFAVQDTLRPDRIVVGVHSDQAETLLREVYAKPVAEGSPLVVTDLPTAELAKVAANSFLATKISFINAMAEICEATDADVAKLAEAIGHDDRIGSKFLRAGIGFGGGCLPKDLRAFVARARELDTVRSVAFLREVDAVNSRARRRMVTTTKQVVGGALAGTHIAILGVTFKPDTDDVRDSPALDIATALDRRGARVVVTDPQGTLNARRVAPQLRYTTDAMEAMSGAEVVLHLTEWQDYAALDPREAAQVVMDRQIIDGRNTLDVDRWRRAGWRLHVPGRPGVSQDR